MHRYVIKVQQEKVSERESAFRVSERCFEHGKLTIRKVVTVLKVESYLIGEARQISECTKLQQISLMMYLRLVVNA